MNIWQTIPAPPPCLPSAPPLVPCHKLLRHPPMCPLSQGCEVRQGGGNIISLWGGEICLLVMGMMRGAHNANSVTVNNWICSPQGDIVPLLTSLDSPQNVTNIHPCRGGLNIYWGCEMCNSIESESVTARSCDIVTTKQDSALIGSAPLCPLENIGISRIHLNNEN